MKKVARLRQAQDEFVPPHNSTALNKAAVESNVGVRTTGRIKKPKAVFDPSDNYVPRAQRSVQAAPPQQQQHATSTKSTTSPSSSTTTSRDKQQERSLSIGSNSNIAASSTQDYDICSVCQKREPRRGGNYRNKLLTCVDCNEKLHRGCASTDFFDASTTALRQSYKCDGCRSCEICGKGETNPKKNCDMITCSKCIISFHLNCHTPKVSKHQQSSRSWKCAKSMPNAPTTTATTITKNKSANDDDSMPVTVIRQIIGYDANMQSLPKPPNQVQAVNHQSTPETAAPTAQPKNEDDLEEQTEEQPHSPEAVSAAKSNTDSHATSSSSSECELTTDDDDEDFHYVEKKKRKTVLECSNGKSENSNEVRENGNKAVSNNGSNNGVDIDMANDATENSETEQKPQINDSRNHNAVSDDSLPKREVIKTWSVETLFDYVVKFFPKEAHVFKEHEIDGNALLLLKRSDVVKKLPLKLGPSLRLFQFILQIQTQKANDPTLGWDCSIDT